MRHFRSVMAVLVVVAAVAACGGGSDSTPPSPPAFTNLAATRWSVVDTVSAANSCNAPIGTTDSWILHVIGQSGNNIAFYDERGLVADAVNGTMSGYVISYSGNRYPIQGCVDMTASYAVTLDTGGTSFSGTATIYCNDAPPCYVPVNVAGTKL